MRIEIGLSSAPAHAGAVAWSRWRVKEPRAIRRRWAHAEPRMGGAPVDARVAG